MPDLGDLARLVRGPRPSAPLPAVWDFFPCHAAAVGGVKSFLQYYLDVETKLTLQQRLQALLPSALILPGVFPDLGVVVEASAFGGQVLWFDDGAPFIGPAIAGPAAIDGLSPPPAGRAGLMPLCLVQRERMRRSLEAQGAEMAAFGFSMGPAEVAGLVLGYEEFYVAMHEETPRLSRLLEITTETVIAWLRAQERACGGLQALAVADHVLHQVSPEHAETLLLPPLRAVFAEFPGPVKIYHNEGYHSPAHVALVRRLGAEVWHFGSDVHPLPDLLAQVGDGLVLFGGLNPHGVMRRGTPAEVQAETRAAVAAARGLRLVLSTGTGTTPDTSLENHRAMIAAALG